LPQYSPTRNPKPETRNPKPETRNPKPETRNPKPIARILLNTIGSAGDVHPFVAIALALRQRGHEVLILTNPYFKDRILAAGVGFWPLGAAETYARLIKDPRLVAGSRSPFFIIDELIRPAFAPTIDAIRQINTAFRPDVIVGHHIAFGAAAASELFGIPHVQCVLAPLFWFSRCERLALPSFPLPNAPLFIDRALRSFARFTGRHTFDPAINRLRREVGLPPRQDLISRAARGGDGVLPYERLADGTKGTPTLALWSPHVRGTLPDDPCTGIICGFASWDRPPTSADDIQRERETIHWMEDGPPPVVVTLGSSVSHHGAAVYRIAADACARAGTRALLLTGGSMDTSPWPEHIRAVSYASYSRVMPRGCATVHHAGIGTLAAAMRAGTPEIIIPFANDEFDNAARGERLGVAMIVKRRKLSPRSLAEAIQRVGADQAMTGRARALSIAMRDEDGAARAAKEIERIASGSAR
jgi:rhamnosyltransferase subunit B